jgi:hypothetical protein
MKTINTYQCEQCGKTFMDKDTCVFHENECHMLPNKSDWEIVGYYFDKGNYTKLPSGIIIKLTDNTKRFFQLGAEYYTYKDYQDTIIHIKENK